VIVSADAGATPVRRAIVTVTGGAIVTNLSTVTDDRGRFAFTNLQPGRYLVSVSKPAYLTTAFGATKPGRPGTAIQIASGQRLTDLRIALPLGAVITGAVRDFAGAPAAGIQIVVARAEEATGGGGYRSTSDDWLTDDRGVYRAFGLEPGEYIVAAVPRLTGQGAITRPATADVDATIRQLQQQRGRGAPVGTVPGAAPTIASLPHQGYAPMFYPGTPMSLDAARVAVTVGEVRSGVDIPLDLVPVVTVEGTIAMFDGSPIPAVQLSMNLAGPALPWFSSLSFSQQVRPDGRFTFWNITPGRYILAARATAGVMPPVPGAAPVGRGSAVASPAGAPMLWALADIAIVNQTSSSVSLTLRPALTISGRVVFEGTTLKPPADLTAIRVGISRLDAAPSTMVSVSLPPGFATQSSVQTKADGTFAINPVLPGAYVLSASVLGAPQSTGWRVKSAMIAGRDALDTPLEIGLNGTDLTDAVITLTDARAEISGTLQTAAGQPASEYFVVVFSADRAHWFAGSRRVLSTRPGSDGRFVVADLPGGDYLVAALTDLDRSDLLKPSFLEQLVPAAIKVTVPEGSRVRQDLRIGR
jgi:uncharacterized protein (DUF2141 family)